MARRPPLLVLVVLLAACGGSSAPGPESAERASPAEQTARAKPADGRTRLIADAKTVCGRLEGRVARLGPPSSPPTTKEMLAVIGAWERTVEELRALEPPAAERRRFRRMLDHFENSIRAARAMTNAEDETALAAVAGMVDQGQRGSAIARRYGLETCSLFPARPTHKQFERAMRDQMRSWSKQPRLRVKPSR